MRKPLIAGNWKMHLTLAESRAMAEAFRDAISRSDDDRDIAIFPATTAIARVARALSDCPIRVGAQDGHEERSGAFTGAVSMVQVKDAGATLALCGHSERRWVFGDDDACVSRKVAAALDAGLDPVLCVGEKLEERDAGQWAEIVVRQLDAGLAFGVQPAGLKRVIIAYEPVWAIGTGRTASVDQAQEVHAAIRSHFAEKFGAKPAESVRILYGGSVKPDNVAALMGAPDIDGVLVGGASLNAASFDAIIHYDRLGR